MLRQSRFKRGGCLPAVGRRAEVKLLSRPYLLFVFGRRCFLYFVGYFSGVVTRVFVYRYGPLYDFVYVLSYFFWVFTYHDGSRGATAVDGGLAIFRFNSYIRTMVSIFTFRVFGTMR